MFIGLGMFGTFFSFPENCIFPNKKISLIPKNPPSHASLENTLDDDEMEKLYASRREAQMIVQQIFSDSEITHYDKSGPRPKHAIMKMSEYGHGGEENWFWGLVKEHLKNTPR